MAIQWFPGHMHKAQKEIRRALTGIDVIVELLDARLPCSSLNPLLEQIRGDRPGFRLLNKSDLADPEQTELWVQWFHAHSPVPLLTGQVNDDAMIARLPTVIRQHSARIAGTRPLHAMIVGIPNVGKSSLINRLKGRAVATTGDTPAVTRAQQRVDIGAGVVLCDTPGVLWPNLENRSGAYRLALSGAIRDTAIDAADVALFAAELLLERYAERLRRRYTIETDLPDDPVALLEHIGRLRGCLGAGGVIDYDRTGKLLIHEVRNGLLGRLTFETPQQIEQEMRLLEVQRAERAEKKQQKIEERRRRFKANKSHR